MIAVCVRRELYASKSVMYRNRAEMEKVWRKIPRICTALTQDCWWQAEVEEEEAPPCSGF